MVLVTFEYLSEDSKPYMMKLDILAIVAHPDDVEFSFSGTLITHQKKGYKIGIVDLTQGELGTRGTPEIREEEAKAAAEVMKLSARENLKMEDGFFENNKANQLKIVTQIRRFQPSIVIANAIHDRHPDHTRASQLVETAFFLSGLKAISTEWEGEAQAAYRPQKLYYSIQSNPHDPDVLVDISDVKEERDRAMAAFKSQFFDPESKEPETYISTQDFKSMVDSRLREWGQRIGVQYAEGFTVKHYLGVKNMFDLL